MKPTCDPAQVLLEARDTLEPVLLEGVTVALLLKGPLNGSVFAWLPFVTDLPVAGSKNMLGLLAGSWA